jgi:hypothetical protein
MMRIAKYITLLLLIALLPLHADFAKLGTSGAQFLKISVGRGAAMGEAFVAIADDASATFWNAAGLGVITKREIAFMHNEWISDIRHEYISAALPLGASGTIGLSVTSLSMGEMEILRIDDPNTVIREDTGTGEYFSASDIALGVSYGRMFTDRLSAGIGIKAIQQRIWNMAASGIAADFGIQYNTGLQGLRIAAAISNFGADITFNGRDLDIQYPPDYGTGTPYDPVPGRLTTTPYPLPLIFRFGLAWEPISTASSRFTVALDLVHPNDNYETLNLGLEYGYLNTFFVRAGYLTYLSLDYMKLMTGGEMEVDPVTSDTSYTWGDETEWLLNNLTAGVGFNLNPGNMSLKIDYAYMNKGVLSHTHRFGLAILF